MFWFNKTDLKEISNNESEENKLLSGYKVVGIKFLEGTNTAKEYIYACYDDVQEGDYVVVKSGHHGWGIARINQIYGTTPDNTDIPVEYNREVIAKFDPSPYFKRVEKIKRLGEIKRDMDKKVKELQNLAVYEALAKDNPELKELLEEFKSLI